MPYKLKIIQEFELFKPVITNEVSLNINMYNSAEIKDKYLPLILSLFIL